MKRHEMKLYNEPFEKIKSGTKTVELRLNDDKRRELAVNDIIVFTNVDSGDKLHVKVIGLKSFKNFIVLYDFYDKNVIGYSDDDVANPNDMSRYYTKESIDKYGALGIEIQVIE